MDNPRAEKVAVVNEVRDRMDAADGALLTEYRGLTVAEHAPRLRANGREEAAVDGRKVKGGGHGEWLTSRSRRRRGSASDPAILQSDFRTSCAGGDTAP